MPQTPEQDDSNAQRQAAALPVRPVPEEHELRVRSQAALVRESLVRCPGIGGPAVH